VKQSQILLKNLFHRVEHKTETTAYFWMFPGDIVVAPCTENGGKRDGAEHFVVSGTLRNRNDRRVTQIPLTVCISHDVARKMMEVFAATLPPLEEGGEELQ